MIIKAALSVCVVLITCGCAARPSEIPPSMISHSLYADTSCGQLELQWQLQNRDLASLSKRQNDHRSWNPATGFLESILNDGYESEIATAKGHLIVIRNQLDQRCGESTESSEQK